jgi:type II secretory pathway pseudopilin PulG
MYGRSAKGLTLLEVIIAMFIFLVGIVGVLAAMPTGINSASWVIFQDCAIHLAHSKFSEFRRDRIDPTVAGTDNPAAHLAPTPNGYLPTTTPYVPGNQEPFNTSGDPWRDFAHQPGQPYQYFDDIDRYEWCVSATQQVDNGAGSGDVPVPAKFSFPTNVATTSNIGLFKVDITVRMKGTTRQMRFSEYFFSYGQL